MFDTILLAVDGSECARRAAGVGIDLAAAYGATVHVVSVVRDDWDDEAGERERSRARSAVETVAETAEETGLAVETHVVEGKPYRGIVRTAGSTGADLIVMGREGRSGIAERVLGSATERVLRRADVPVLVTPCYEGMAPDEYDRVLVTTDGSDAARDAGPYAADAADRLGAALHVLSVVDVQSAAGVFDAGGVDREFVERLEGQAREATEDIAPDADARRNVVEGQPHEAIVEYVDGNGIDLVVMASTGLSDLSGQHLGSVTGRVLRTVGVPVLVVPE